MKTKNILMIVVVFIIYVLIMNNFVIKNKMNDVEAWRYIGGGIYTLLFFFAVFFFKSSFQKQEHGDIIYYCVMGMIVIVILWFILKDIIAPMAGLPNALYGLPE